MIVNVEEINPAPLHTENEVVCSLTYEMTAKYQICIGVVPCAIVEVTSQKEFL